ATPSPAPSPDASPSPSPSPEPTPAPEPTARLGFPTTDLGRTHAVDPTRTLQYGFCPPTSGDHLSIQGEAPLAPAVYPAGSERSPGGWVHNLEHGYVVLLYTCPGGAVGGEGCPSAAEMAQIQQWFDTAAAPPVSQCPKKVLAVRFDEMSTRFALVSWNRAMLFNEFDLDAALTFAQQWMEHDAVPEQSAC
ncbi:MAG: DUF3105 domain-containing protein, partial [Chloroflexota bacterium]|nr:DUF3105 domain-containing protein [Chloroflexota bacterium]